MKLQTVLLLFLLSLHTLLSAGEPIIPIPKEMNVDAKKANLGKKT